MKKQIIEVENGIRYLSQVISAVPDNCLLNKGITGCGGTTVEIKSKRNSIILVPTINLVKNKVEQENIFGFYGDIEIKRLHNYIQSTGYKKIIATYDSLEKLMAIISNIYEDYFLLIDEYHTFIEYYSFRRKAVKMILNNFRKFKKFCFMTATPISDDYILEELKDIDIIEYKWNSAVKVKIEVRNTTFIQKELIYEIKRATNYNLHIFVNSIEFIKRVVKAEQLSDFRTVCSAESATKTLIINPTDINSEVKRINFYTSAAFEGCDIYDENGFVIIISDSGISTTIKDISTSIVQICGRVRNSKYKDQALFILNTSKHRYSMSKIEFENFIEKNEELGKETIRVFNQEGPLYKEAESRKFNQETYNSIYVDMEEKSLFFDPNLKQLDKRNFILYEGIYKSNISVLKEINNSNVLEGITKKKSNYDSITEEIIKELDIGTYTYEQISSIITPILERNKISTSKQMIGRYLSPITTTRKLTVNGTRKLIYQLNLK